MKKSAKLWWFAGLIALCLLVAIVVAVAAPQEPVTPPVTPATTAAATARAARGMLTGLVISVDAAKNLLVIQTRDRTQVNVVVAADTRYIKRTKGALADLALGQDVTLAGHATAMSADEIGMSPPPVAPEAGAAPVAAPTTAAAASQALAARRNAARVRIHGVVTKLEPLTVTTASGGEVVVTPSATATFNLSIPATLADVQAGQRVGVLGQQAADGSYAATLVTLSDAPVRAVGKGHHNK